MVGEIKSKRIGIAWQLSDGHGWGVFGLNLVRRLLADGPCPPMLLAPPHLMECDDALRQLLAPLIEEQAAIIGQIEQVGRQAMLGEVLMLFSFGNRFLGGQFNDVVRGHANVGFIFFEGTGLDEAAHGRAAFLDRILAGSSWNRDFLTANGFDDVVFVSQGVDTELFRSRSGPPAAGGRFRVFSGGKLEFRKGQDIALAAFKRFHARHPDSVLTTAWHNPWPESARDLARSPHLEAAPDVTGETIPVAAWAAANGLPEDAFVDLGWVPNARMPDILRSMDAGLFPNRCEGGTNLVAMEAMACGLPCIVSANTGHNDIIAEGNCYALRDQGAVEHADDPVGLWGESSVEEAVECLERAYTDREDAEKRGAAAAALMAERSWKNQVAELIAAIEDLL